jgi:hypothetical protein
MELTPEMLEIAVELSHADKDTAMQRLDQIRACLTRIPQAEEFKSMLGALRFSANPVAEMYTMVSFAINIGMQLQVNLQEVGDLERMLSEV